MLPRWEKGHPETVVAMAGQESSCQAASSKACTQVGGEWGQEKLPRKISCCGFPGAGDSDVRRGCGSFMAIRTTVARPSC
jgi:hypothetical protein